MSIVKVAKIAKVSPATVSRVINNSPVVTPELAAQVRSAMQSVNYIPPQRDARRGPKSWTTKSAHSGNVAMLALGMDQKVVLAATAALAQSISDFQMNLIVVPVPDCQTVPAIISDRKIDGVILQGSEPQGDLATALRQIPTVWMMTRRSYDFWADHVEPDNWSNGAVAATWLFRQGIRDYAVLNTHPNYPAFRIRCHAFEHVVSDEGCRVVKLYESIREENTALDPHLASLAGEPAGQTSAKGRDIARELAALVVEPLVQGAAGMVMHPPGFLKGLEALCREHEVLLVCDEVATGFEIGRAHV